MLASASMQVIEKRGAQSNNNIKMMLLDWALINTMVAISNSINNDVPINWWLDITVPYEVNKNGSFITYQLTKITRAAK
jgi:hypothetical protein